MGDGSADGAGFQASDAGYAADTDATEESNADLKATRYRVPDIADDSYMATLRTGSLEFVKCISENREVGCVGTKIRSVSAILV